MRALAILSVVVALWGSPAAAQDTDAAMFRMEQAALPDDPEDLRNVVAFTKCAVSDGRNSQLILQALPGSNANLRATYQTASLSRSCHGPGKKWMTPSWFIRGVAAEYFLDRDFDPVSGAVKHRPQKIFDMPDSAEAEHLDADVQRELVLLRFGSCIAAGDRAGAMRLLGTETASGEEAKAFAALTPTIGNCIAAGTTFKINKTQLRAYVAEGAYRSAVAAQAGRK